MMGERANVDTVSADQIRAIFERAPAGMALLDPTGRVTLANAALEQLLGWRAGELAGVDLLSLAVADARGDLARTLQFLHRDGRARRLEVGFVTTAGLQRLCLLHLAAAADPAGGPSSLIATLEDISERRTAEEQMQVRSERYRLLVEHASDIFFSIDLNGRFSFVNQSACRLMLYTQDQLIGMHYLDLIRPDHRVAAERFYVHQVTHRIPSTYYEFPAVTGDGRELWLGQHVQLIFKDDRVVSAQAAARDITTQRRAEEALRESEERYRTLAEAARDQIFIIDRDDRITYVNRGAAAQFNAAADQLIGRQRHELFPPRVAERQAASLRLVFDTGESHYIETETDFPGRVMWLGTELAPIKSTDGRVTAVLGVSRDITLQKRTEEALRASEERLRAVVSNVPIILWATDRTGALTLCVGRGLTDLGLDPDRVIGRPVEALYRHPGLGDHVRRALAGETFRSQMLVDGRTFDMWYSPLTTHGEISGVIGVAVDITDPTLLQERLLQMEKMEAIGRLAGGVAHDFNNQLTAILGYAEMLMDSLDAGDPRRLDVQEITRAGQRAADFTEQLLAFGRRQSRKPRVLDLTAIIANIEQLLRRTVREDVAFDTELAPGLHPVRADPTQLEQLLMNLVLNARDAMVDGGRLQIRTANVDMSEQEARAHAPMPPGRYVMLEVSDTGRGMDAETRSHLFEPFFTTKSQGKGTGLGLASVYGIVKQSGGYIWVTSEVDRGTIFRIYLVPVDGPVEPLDAILPSSTPVGGTETILVVEDDPTVRAMTCAVLSGHGYAVLEAASGEAALDVERHHPAAIDLLFTDVVMPGMNGRELAIEFARRRPSTRVLYTTGYTKDASFRPDLVTGLHLLEKPFVPSGLLRTIREVLDSRLQPGDPTPDS